MKLQLVKKAAAIIGATGGLGTEYAHQLSAKNFDLILIDINKSRLDELSSIITRSNDISITTLEANLVDQASISGLAAKLSAVNIDLLVYAAGYGERKAFKDEEIKATMNMISVHTLAAVELIHSVLPSMLKNGAGGIIVVSSLSAFIPAAGSSIYSATKAFLNNFLESLHMEVHKYGIHIQSLCPGLTRTNFHKIGNSNRFNNLGGGILWMDAKDVVKISLNHVNKNSVLCIPGLINNVIRFVISLLPRRLYYLISNKIN